MYLLGTLIFAGLLSVTEPPPPAGSWQAGSGAPAVFVLPDPGSVTGNAAVQRKLPTWLCTRELDI